MSLIIHEKLLQYPKALASLISEDLIKGGLIVQMDGAFKCVACGKKRKFFSKMRSHLQAHGIGNRYPCPLCGLVISDEAHRRRHIKNVHKQCLNFKQIREMLPSVPMVPSVLSVVSVSSFADES